jgi:PAS domain S-box-containing protein
MANNGNLKNTVGENLLETIQDSYLTYIESSAAIYETNGDYAVAIFTSKYCDYLNQASRKIAGKTDDEALKSGKWICHEDCWATSLKSIKDKKPCEIECSGGIKIYAAPIIAEDTVIGSNNIGLSNPPTDEKKIEEIARKYKVDSKELLRIAKEYPPRPEYIFNAAKKHVLVAADTIVEFYLRLKAEEELQKAKDELEIKVNERTSKLESTVELLQKEINERKKAEEKILEQRNLSEIILNSSPDIIVLKDQKSVYKKVNTAFCKFIGKHESEIIGKTDYDLFPAEEAKMYISDDTKVMETGQPQIQDEAATGKEGIKWLQVAKTPVRDIKGEITGILCSVRDVTKHKDVVEALKESEQSYRTLAENLPVIVYRVYIRENNRIQFFSNISESLVGYKEIELEKSEVCSIESLIHPQDRPKVIAAVKQAIANNKSFSLEYRLRHKNGDIKYFLENGKPITGEDGKPSFIDGVIHDITERKKAEEQVKASLKEKEVLLQEIHHRVKNNMAVVSSLLRLQSVKVKDEHYRAMFNESVSRIKAMGLIHERLYQSEEVSQILFSDYIKDMVGNIYKSYGLSSRIKLITDIEKITLGIDASIPCGLIVNELITNSMKYAFPENRVGEIKVSLTANDKGQIKLTVADNGVGMPEGLDFRNTDSLGLTLVNALVGQLQGEIEFYREKGTVFAITFKG